MSNFGNVNKVSCKNNDIKGIFSDPESEYNSHISKSCFIDEIEKRQIDLRIAALKQKSANVHFHNLNLLIREFRNVRNESTIDMMVHLFEYYYETPTQLLNSLNEENIFHFKKEVKSRTKKNEKSTAMSFFLN